MEIPITGVFAASSLCSLCVERRCGRKRRLGCEYHATDAQMPLLWEYSPNAVQAGGLYREKLPSNLSCLSLQMHCLSRKAFRVRSGTEWLNLPNRHQIHRKIQVLSNFCGNSFVTLLSLFYSLSGACSLDCADQNVCGVTKNHLTGERLTIRPAVRN